LTEGRNFFGSAEKWLTFSKKVVDLIGTQDIIPAVLRVASQNRFWIWLLTERSVSSERLAGK